jgi:hypothetical protein
MKRMTESRGDGLRECRAQRARRLCSATWVTKIDAVDTGKMTEFVNNSALLCHQKQQPEAYRFNHISHSNGCRKSPQEP